MDIKGKLMQALKEAMQQKNDLKKNTITMLRAAILQVEKDEQKVLTNQEIEIIVAKEIKKRKEAIPEYEKGLRQDIVNSLQEEIKILQVYLPEQLNEEQIKSLVLEAIKVSEAQSMKDIGKVMSLLKDKTAGKADGKLVSEIVKAELSNL